MRFTAAHFIALFLFLLLDNGRGCKVIISSQLASLTLVADNRDGKSKISFLINGGRMTETEIEMSKVLAKLPCSEITSESRQGPSSEPAVTFQENQENFCPKMITKL